MTPPTDKLEAETREEIDAKLEAAGWVIQDKKAMNLFAGEQSIHGVAVREMDTDTGPADYMLFIQGKACGIKTSAGQSGVAGGDVKKCPVVLHPFEEQTRIAELVLEKFEAIERLDLQLDMQLLSNAGNNKLAILALAFSGGL